MKVTLTPQQIRCTIKILEYTRGLIEAKVGDCTNGGFQQLHRLTATLTNERVDEILEKLKIAIGEA